MTVNIINQSYEEVPYAVLSYPQTYPDRWNAGNNGHVAGACDSVPNSTDCLMSGFTLYNIRLNIEIP